MYQEEILNKKPGQRVRIKYDCEAGFPTCGKENTPVFKVAQKNFEVNDGKHICKSCMLRAKNPMKNKEVQAKVKQTNLEKYGSTVAMNRAENIVKRSEKFKDAEFVEQWSKKRKQTNLERYGVEHAAQNEQVKKKQRQTMVDKYGVEFPYQSPEIMQKMKASNLEKYGVENVAALPEVQLKMAQTTLERYGVEHYNQLPEMKDYLRENCKEWLAGSYETGGPNKGIIRPEEWNQKQRETVLEAIKNGTWKGGGKHSLRGLFKGAKCKRTVSWFRSSFELKTYLWLEDNDNVISYDYEPFAISYMGTDGHSRFYFPDFLIIRRSERPLLLEIKNDFTINSAINISKSDSAIKYTNDCGLDFQVWANAEIEGLKIDLKKFASDPRIEITQGFLQNSNV